MINILRALRGLLDRGKPRTFESCVRAYFQPVADRAGLLLQKKGVGYFEVRGVKYCMRIRDGTGHGRGFLVTLVPPRALNNDGSTVRGEIGLDLLLKYSGETPVESNLFTWARYRRAMQKAAIYSESCIVPFVTGKRSDLEKIDTFIEEQKREMLRGNGAE